ncbi:MAG TPA: hypothetical protein VMC62_01220, partial [Longilinea sp.]|nr:hypothetical protein [Longilinea sp.]
AVSRIQDVEFVDNPIYYNLSPLTIRYNENWYLVSSGAGEFNHGPLSSCEIDRANTAAAVTPTK